MRLIKQSDTTKPIVFLLVSSTDHVTPVTGVTPTVTISKNGGAFASPTGTVAEIGNGWYSLTPSSTDTNTLGPLLVHATATGADPVDLEYQVVAFDPYAQANLGLTNLDAAITTRQPSGPVDLNIDQSTVTIGTVNTLGATARSQVNTEVDNVLNTAVPATPNVNSVYERIKSLDDNYTSTRALNLDNLDALVSSRSSHTAQDVRAEMDTNSTKLANLDATVSSRSTLTTADVLAQVNAALDQAISELSQAQPPATPSLRQAAMLLYMALRNKRTVTATVDKIYNDAGTAIVQYSISDDGTTMTKGKATAGA